MSDSNENYGETPSVGANASMYNTYGLATQGFVWAAISSVSGDWGKGHVKKVNGLSPDLSGNVGVASISSLDYSGDLNQINSDLSAVIGGETGHRVLSDRDRDYIISYADSISGSTKTQFESLCSLIPTEATSANKLADKEYVSAQIERQSSAFRGSWNTWTAVPSNSELYPVDSSGNRIPKNGDYLIVLNAGELTYRASVSYSIIGSELAENVLSFEIGHILTKSDIDTIYAASIYTVLVRRNGTWRFRYSGTWMSSGKGGWQPEYEMSRTAFTTDQWNAINSGITQEKLTSFTSSSARWDNVSHEFEIMSSGLYRVSFEVETTSANNRSVFDTVSSLSGAWSASTSSISTSASKWNSAYSEIAETSANNRSSYSTLNVLSAYWEATKNKVSASSGSWDSAYSEIAATSANNRSAYSSLNSLSGNWNSAYTEISTTSANNRSVYSTTSENSGAWKSSSETVAASSKYWDSVYTSVLESSAKWNESEGSTKAYTDMVATSALTSAKKYTDFVSTSALTSAKTYAEGLSEAAVSEANIYSTFIATSALTASKSYTDEQFSQKNPKVDSVYGTVEAASANWNAAYTEIAASSADIRSVYSSTSENSGNWNLAFSTTDANSANWNSAYSSMTEGSGKWNSVFSTVAANSAVWEESSGGTKAYTDMMATSALTSAKKYTDEFATAIATSALTSASEYASFVATSALTSSKSYTEEVSGNIYDHFTRYVAEKTEETLSTAKTYTDSSALTTLESASAYSDFIATSALTSANATSYGLYSDAIEKSAIYSDFASTSALTSANSYTDSIVEGVSGYAETLATSAITSANIYSEFMASSALTSAKSYADFVSESFAISALTSAISYTDSVTSEINKTATFTVAWNSTSGISDYASVFQNPVNGDVIILKKQLFEGSVENFRFTSFTYCSGTWHAMDGDYDSKNVFFSENLTTTTDIGNIKVDEYTGNAVISSRGKNINSVFRDIFMQEKNPAVTLPLISSVSTTGVGTYESGTVVEAKFSFTANNGIYEYGPESMALFDSYSATFNGTTISTIPAGGSFSIFTIGDSMSSCSNNGRIAIRGHYTTDTAVPFTNLGNLSESCRITSDYTEYVYSNECMRSYRQCFYDTSTSRITLGMITSPYIRNLSGKTRKYPEHGDTIDIPFDIGRKSIVFAVPKNAVNKIRVIDNNSKMDVTAAFTVDSQNVKDASESNDIPYHVYIKNFADANDTKNTYTIKFEE